MSDKNGRTEFAWLVEVTTCGGPRWLCVLGGRFDWTSIASDAIRFARRTDAVVTAGAVLPQPPHYPLMPFRVTEHDFCTVFEKETVRP